jgi:hypothetical protein
LHRAGALVAVVVLSLAGCGRSAGEEFREDSLRPLEERIARERARVAATLRVVRPGNARDAAALREDVEAVDRSVRRVAGLVPPAPAREPFERYVRALRGLVTELRRFAARLRSDDRAALRTIVQRTQDAAARVQEGDEALERALLAED